ncbi:MAG: glycoside hydrolase family 20 protein [Bacteroidota bacterium]|nr:glycoside hydrolase family 20 protein [Bacteroidota bacterium]
MKKVLLLICFVACCVWAKAQINIVPQPAEIIEKKGSFSFKLPNIRIFVSEGDSLLMNEAEYLRELFYTYCDTYEHGIYTAKKNSAANLDNSIILSLSNNNKLGQEGYVLDISERRILISANTPTGVFYGIETLLQMLGTDFQTAKIIYTSFSHTLPCVKITDYPRFAYRGKHLDCSRHFFSVDYIKRYLNLLAFHKINTFHWHLTDDQGWRIEIKKYPLLTQKGSIRKETLIGHYSDKDEMEHEFDGKEYGGYYTQEEIKEIVAYAKQRHINIIPEIEIPGHASAAMSAYPEFSCRGEQEEVICTWGVFENVMCSKEATFRFIEDILDEVCALFPSEYVHIGGDECPTTRWAECATCKANMQRLGLSLDKFQSYFTHRVEEYLKTKGRKIIGWDEILDKGVDKDPIIMSWQGEQGGINAAKQGNYAIMVPSAYLYFNFYQGVAATEPLSFGGFTPLKKVYTYEPIASILQTSKAKKYIMGMQACTWTEYIQDSLLLEYNDFPRLAAMSERAWSKDDVRDYDSFVQRLNTLLNAYDMMKVNYSKSHFAVNLVSERKKNKILLTLSSPLPKGTIYYTLDGSEPTTKSKVYNKPISLDKNTILKTFAYRDERHFSPILTAEYHINKATGKKYDMKEVNPQYSGGTAYALTDGLKGNKKSFDRWVGTLGKDYEVVLDLEGKEKINSVSINFLNEEGSWIFLPTSVEILVSNDKKDWLSIGEITQKELEDNPKVVNYQTNNTSLKTKDKKYRYVRIFAKSIGNCPENHPGKGYPAHTFADEIEIN